MFANRFTAYLDACVLAPAANRDLILCLAEDKFFRPRWSEEVLSETERAIVKMILRRFPEHKEAEEKAKYTIGQMTKAFPEALVSNDYKKALESGLTLPDTQDVHVLAAAIHCRASTIVTDNIKHFPAGVLAQHNIEAKTADEFIADEIDLDQIKAVETVRRLRASLKRPEITASELLIRMEARGLVETTRLLRPFESLI